MRKYLSYISRYAAILITILVAIGVAAPGLLAPVCLAAGLIWILRSLAAGDQAVRTPIDLPIFLLLILLPINFLISAQREISGPQLLRLFLGIMLFYALVNGVRSQRATLWLYRGYLAAGLALVGVAFISVDWTQAKYPFIPDAFYSVFSSQLVDSIHPNVLAGTLLPFALLAAANALRPLNRMRIDNFLALGAFPVIAVMLVLSQSRSALLALAVGSLVLVTLRWRFGRVTAGLAVGAALLYWVLDPAGPQGFLFGANLMKGLPGRVDIWERAIFLIQDFPFTGVGMGLFHPVVSNFYPFFGPDPARVDHAHQLFLQVAVDLGIPGLIFWLSIYLGVLASAWAGFRRGQREKDWVRTALGAALIAVQVSMAVHGLFDVAVWGMVRSAPLFWGVWAGAMVALMAPSDPERDKL